ncbi:hypothetical protein [uncultured Psychrobacter sp.]|uniref:hypothetical protein n=1 Tax=uncultured Psychrobacter sp. TaxID=259303 RepID=UPI003459B2BC
MPRLNSQYSPSNPIFDLSNPNSVYDFVKAQIGNISSRVDQLNNGTAKIDQKSHNETMTSLDIMQQKVDSKLEDFKKNAEWKHFTIAFFGETNAGKSTLIESLRIMLGEEVRLEKQQKYDSLVKKLNIDSDEYYRIQSEIKDTDKKISNLTQQRLDIDGKYSKIIKPLEDKKEYISSALDTEHEKFIEIYSKEIEAINFEIMDLDVKIHRIKTLMPWWLKIVYIFKRLEEEKQTSKVRKELILINNDIEDNKNQTHKKKSDEHEVLDREIQEILKLKKNETKDVEKEIVKLENKVKKSRQWMDKFCENAKVLTPFVDGNIIGDGRSDFTRDSISYFFNINNFPVSMLDVPGIEGNESLVEQEIDKAVQKTHAVFYVTAKDAPPNEGTLDRIRKHLSDQTEVWAIYNKQITNPRQLKKKLVSSQDEEKSLSELSIKLTELLGDNYRGTLVVAGLPAFLSQSTCLEPFSIPYEQQRKYLKNMSRDELQKASNLSALELGLKQDIVGNVEDKIRRSNLNKVRELLNDSTEELGAISETYRLLEKDIRKKVDASKISINNHFIELESVLKRESSRYISTFKSSVTKEVYDRIDQNISNSSFKTIFDNEIKDQVTGFEEGMKNEVKKAIEELAENIEKTQTEFLSNVNKITKEYESFAEVNNINFDLDFSISNGVNMTALMSTLVGVGIVMWWNPVGWVAITATVAGLALSFAKSIFGAFSSNYKMEQQRKNVSKNLPKVCQKLQAEVNDSIEQLVTKMTENKAEIYKSFETVPESIHVLNKDLKYAITHFVQISDELLVS